MTGKEALERLYDGFQDGMAGRSFYDIIKQDLDRLEKLEEAIEIIKSKIEFEDLGEMQSGNMYRGYFNDCLDQEEYELIEEVFGE